MYKNVTKSEQKSSQTFRVQVFFNPYPHPLCPWCVAYLFPCIQIGSRVWLDLPRCLKSRTSFMDGPQMHDKNVTRFWPHKLALGSKRVAFFFSCSCRCMTFLLYTYACMTSSVTPTLYTVQINNIYNMFWVQVFFVLFCSVCAGPSPARRCGGCDALALRQKQNSLPISSEAREHASMRAASQDRRN